MSDLERDSKGEFLDAREEGRGGGSPVSNSDSSDGAARPKFERMPTDKYGFFIDPENTVS